MGRILAVDYGTVRIGLAISDPLKVIARPLRVLKPHKEDPIAAIRKIVEEMDVERVIVGHPIPLSGRKSEMTRKAEEFYQRLKATLPVPVELYDETFTTALAEQTLREQGRKPSRERERLDMIAAAHLLQLYLKEAYRP